MAKLKRLTILNTGEHTEELEKIINPVAMSIPSNRYYGLGTPFPTKNQVSWKK